MSQRAVEAALGRLICDESFRHAFYEDAEGAVARAGFQLTRHERESLIGIMPSAIEAFVPYVNESVRWVADPGPQASDASRVVTQRRRA